MIKRRGFVKILFAVILLLFCVQVVPTVSSAGWITKLVDKAGDAAGDGRKVARGGRVSDLGSAGVYIKNLPEGNRGHAIAAAVSDDGHWHLMNGKGERVTVSGSEELELALKWMVSDDFNRDRRLITFYIAKDGLVRNPEFIKILPARSRHAVVSKGKVYPVLIKRFRGRDILYAKLRKNLDVALKNIGDFREAVWQVEQPLKRAGIRLLSLTPEGAKTAKTIPVIGERGLPDPDFVDPYAIGDVFASLKRQTVLLTGKIDGDLLYFKKSGDSDLSVFLTDISKAARANDVNLIVLNTGKTQQPGGRDWLWRKVGISGLGVAVQQKSFGDFLNVIAKGRGGFDLTIDETKRKRVIFKAKPSIVPKDILDVDNVRENDSMNSVFTDVVSAIRGNVAVNSVAAEMRSSSRQNELDIRIIPGIPSYLQFYYIGSVFLGFAGFPVAQRWWYKLWPPENRADYKTRAALGSAVAIRWILFVLAFLPIVGVAAFFVNLDGLLRKVVLAPWIWISNWFARSRS